MKQKTVYLLTACLLMLAACSDETVLTGSKTSDNDLVLKPGEQKVDIRLGGITVSGSVPATRGSDAISLPGESGIGELVVYSFVNLDVSNNLLDEYDQANYTLERKYHYKANATGNDLVLTADGSNYRVSIPVPAADGYLRSFVIQVNMGDGSGATAVAIEESVRTSATPYNALPVPPLISANDAPIAVPLPMSANCYWEEELTGGYIRKNYRFGNSDLAKGMKASLVRKVSRFDINNPEDTRFIITKITVEKVMPLPGSTETYGFTTTPENAAYMPAVFYVPSLNGNGGLSMSVTITGNLAGAETDVIVPCTDLSLTDNTRYVINITARGENLTGTIEIVPWTDAEEEINGDLTRELNTEVHVSGDGRINSVEGNTIYVGRGFADFDFQVTGATGNSAPIEVIFPDDGNRWDIYAREEDGTWKCTVFCEDNRVLPDYSSRFGYFDVDRTCYYYPPFESSITFVTQDVKEGVKTYKYHEYKIVHQDYTRLFEEGTYNLRPVVLKATGGWVINDENKTITAPIFPGQGSIQLSGGEIPLQFQHSGKEAAMLGRITTDLRNGRTEFHYIMRKDNFMSSEPRTFKMILYHRDEVTGLQVSRTYDVIQPGGNGDVSLLSTGFTVDAGNSILGTRWGKGEVIDEEWVFTPDPSRVVYDGNTLTIKADAAIDSWEPATFVYNISIRSKDRNPILVEIVQGSDWLYLDPFPCRVLDYEHYFMGIRTNDNNVNKEMTQTAVVKVGYRDAQSGRLKTEYINVVREAGSDPW